MKHLLLIVLAAYLTSFSGESTTEPPMVLKRYPSLELCVKAANRLQAISLFPFYQCIESDVALPLSSQPIIIKGQKR